MVKLRMAHAWRTQAAWAKKIVSTSGQPSYCFIMSFSGSFSTMPGKIGNSFCFPGFEAKIVFENDFEQLQLFMFNPNFEV